MTYSLRAQRMVSYAPDYYAYSKLYADLQQAVAEDLDKVAADDADLQQQLYIVTATWGLRYWEKTLDIPIIESDGYEARRSRVLAKWRGIGNFGADLLAALISAYTDVPVRVSVDIANFVVIIEFADDVPGYNDMNQQIQNVIHAHLGVRYRFKVVGTVTIGQDPRLTLTVRDHMNFWSMDSIDRLIWNGAHKFDGQYKFSGLRADNQGARTAQTHSVKIYAVTKNIKPFTAVSQKWNGGFLFDGTRKFGAYVADTPSCGNSVGFTRLQAGVVVEKGAL